MRGEAVHSCALLLGRLCRDRLCSQNLSGRLRGRKAPEQPGGLGVGVGGAELSSSEGSS